MSVQSAFIMIATLLTVLNLLQSIHNECCGISYSVTQYVQTYECSITEMSVGL